MSRTVRAGIVAAELLVKFDLAALDEAAPPLSLSACALGASNVTLAKSQNYLVKPARLAEAPSRKIAITQVTEARDAATRDRIGDKRNMYGVVMGSIVTTEPVTDTVRKGIAETFTTNKHTVVADPSAATLKVEAVVTKFWFDYKTGLIDVECFADVQTRLSVKDRSGTEVFAKDFKGYAPEKTMGGLEDLWARVMDTALADLSREISLSMDLKAALEKTQTVAILTPGQPAS